MGIDTFSIGAGFDIVGCTASFMVNATMQGQNPTVWLRSNYTVKFWPYI